MVTINNLTIIIVTYKTNKKILFDCIDSINAKVKILIIENSNNSIFKEIVEKKYPDLEVVLSGDNLGYGAGNNFGLQRVKTKYALILNPDVVLEKNFFDEINKYFEQKINFHLIGITYKNNIDYETSGLFDEFDKKEYSKSKSESPSDSLIEVDWIIGCTILVDLTKFNTRELFDKNFFMYFEELDLCRRLKLNNGKIYTSKKLIVNHLGNKSSLSTNSDYYLEAEIHRNWHWMWSTFYYHKKHHNYLYAIYKTYGKFFRSLIKFIFFTLILNKKKKLIYYGRFLGILNAIFGKKSWYRIKILNVNDQEN